MSKKKKHKTKKQKEKAKKHQKEYLKNVAAVNNSSTKDDVIKTQKNTPEISPEAENDTRLSLESDYIKRDTKKTVFNIFLFLVIILILYFLEQKFNYFLPLSNSLISLLLK